MGKTYTYFCACFVMVGSFMFGIDSGVITTLISQPRWVEYFNHMSGGLLGGTISCFAGGGVVGCLIAGAIADPIGRKRTIHIASFIALVGTAIQAGSVVVGMFIAGRILAGVAVGMLYSAIPTYQSEIAPPATRGWIVGLHSLGLSVGYTVSSYIGIGTYWIPNDGQWRVPLAIQTVPAMVLCIGMFFLPFSPRWLIERGRYDEAYEVVKRLHFDGKDETFFKAEFHQMKEQIVYEQEHEVTDLKSFFTNPSYRKRLIIACGVQAGNQFTGINCINYYQTSIYASLGQTGYNVLLLAMAYGTIGTICTFISTYKVDKWGRVKTMLISCILLSFIFVLVTVLIGVYGESDNAAGKGAVIAMIYVFVIIFGLGYNGPWASYSTEVFTQATRAKGTAAGTVASLLAQILLVQITPTAFENIGYRFYIVFIVSNACTAVFLWLYCPETKGLTLEEVNALFGDVVVVDIHNEETVKAVLEEVETVNEKGTQRAIVNTV